MNLFLSESSEFIYSRTASSNRIAISNAIMNEIIKGKTKIEILKQAQADKTLIQIQLADKGFSSLTVINDVRVENEDSYFLIDYPAGFREAVAGIETWKIQFRFTGKDRLPYVFNTSGGELTQNDVRIKIPDSIERLQKRANFRIKAPLGTKLNIIKGFTEYKTNVVNISLDGALVLLLKERDKYPALKTGKRLRNIQLEYQDKGGVARIHIKKALIPRLERDPLSKRCYCAIQFTDIEMKEKKSLQDFIYSQQRHFLRKRQEM